jgi:excisionase family DNA binding protein
VTPLAEVDVTPTSRNTESAERLSTGEAAKELGVSGKTVLRWINVGLLPARLTRPGGQYRIDRADVERFMAEQQQVRLRPNPQRRTARRRQLAERSRNRPAVWPDIQKRQYAPLCQRRRPSAPKGLLLMTIVQRGGDVSRVPIQTTRSQAHR